MIVQYFESIYSTDILGNVFNVSNHPLHLENKSSRTETKLFHALHSYDQQGAAHISYDRVGGGGRGINQIITDHDHI